MSFINTLERAVRAVCPIEGISIGSVGDRATWLFQPTSAATASQKAAAQAAIDAFVYDAVADAATTDQDTLNDSLTVEGGVVRALGLVMFAEINKLRVKTGDVAYNLNQFKAALKAQMR